MGDVMIDKRIGKRIKKCREKLGLTQEDFAEKTGLSVNYISTVERGGSFPRCERLITIINGLETSADAIFCDVINASTGDIKKTKSAKGWQICLRKNKKEYSRCLTS